MNGECGETRRDEDVRERTRRDVDDVIASHLFIFVIRASGFREKGIPGLDGVIAAVGAVLLVGVAPVDLV